MTQPVLAVKNLIKDYGEYRAVDNISFSIERGQVMGLLGPNGAGKSTTIQVVVGITELTAGSISYFGQDFKTGRQACLQRANFTSAYNSLQDRLTVRENLLVFAGLYGVQNPALKIAELLDYFEIGRLEKNKYRDLSAGERARVNLSKALLNDPELILMDEPTASLDPDIADKTLSLIETLRRDRQLSILFTSHNMAEVARICDEVIFLDKGKIVSQDTPANHTKRLDRAELVIYTRNKAKLADFLKKRQVEFSADDGALRIQARSADVAGLVAAISKADIHIHDMEVHKPTLEDVFLDIARRNA